MAKLTPEQKAKIDEIQADLEEQVADLEALENESDPEPGSRDPEDWVGHMWITSVFITGYGQVTVGTPATLEQLIAFLSVLSPDSILSEYLN